MNKEREANAGLRRNQMIKITPKTTRRCAVPNCGKTVFASPSFWSQALGKSERTLFFNVDLDRVSKNLVLCSLHFHFSDSITNIAQFNVGFSKRLKLKTLPTILDPTVMSQHTSMSKCFHYVVTIAFSLLQIVWYVLSCFIAFFYLNHSSVHLWGMNVCFQTYTTISQSQQWVFTSESEQSVLMRGVKNSDRK